MIGREGLGAGECVHGAGASLRGDENGYRGLWRCLHTPATVQNSTVSEGPVRYVTCVSVRSPERRAESGGTALREGSDKASVWR